MKTNKVNKQVLKNIIRIKSTNGEPALWICGKDYYRDLSEILTREDLYFSTFGTRSLFNIPLQIVEDNAKIKDDEIILLSDVELRYIQRELEDK